MRRQHICLYALLFMMAFILPSLEAVTDPPTTTLLTATPTLPTSSSSTSTSPTTVSSTATTTTVPETYDTTTSSPTTVITSSVITVISTTNVPTTTIAGSASISVSGGNFEVYTGSMATATGVASAGTISATKGQVTSTLTNGVLNWNWKFTSKDVSDTGAVLFTLAPQNGGIQVTATIQLVIYASPPTISLDGKVVSIVNGQVKNSGTTSSISALKPSVGLIKATVTGGPYTWTSASNALSDDALINGVTLTAISTDGTQSASAFFFISGGAKSPNIYSLTYAIQTDVPAIDAANDPNALENFNEATAYLVGIDSKMVSTAFFGVPGRMRILASGGSIAQVKIINLPLSAAQSMLTNVANGVASGQYATRLSRTGFLSSSSSKVALFSAPKVIDSSGNEVNNPLPQWALITIIAVSSTVGLLCLLFILVKWCGNGSSCCHDDSKYQDGSSVGLSYPKNHYGHAGKYEDNFEDDFSRRSFIPATNESTSLLAPPPALPSNRRLFVDPLNQGTLRTIYLRIVSNGETLPLNIGPNESLREIKRKLFNYFPEFEDQDLTFLFNGQKIPDTARLADTQYSDGTIIHVVCRAENKKSPGDNKSASVGITDILSALAKRASDDVLVRQNARQTLAAIDNPSAVNEAVKSLMEAEATIKTVKLPRTDENWLPWDEETPDESVFDVGKALPFQRTEYFTLLGKPVGADGPIIQRGLCKPMNVHSDGNVEGVNAIVWQAVVGSKTVVIKGLLPYNDLDGYEKQYASQESEYKVPLSLPPNPHVIPILHQFIGSSVLVYPWIPEPMRGLSAEIFLTQGRRFIRRFTTYVVMEYYPSTLRKFCNDLKASGEVITERQLCLMALQLLKAVQHLNNHKVVHRDIKDDNVFRTSEGILVVADFGCAMECGTQVYQRKEDILNQIGAPQFTAPEVHRALNEGPLRKNPSLLWDILRQNDVYAVGVMLYGILGIRVPNTTAPYESSDIPDLPSIYSPIVNKFLRGLVEYDPSVRTTAAAGVRKLSFILWGPPSAVAASNTSVSQWLIERRLDLVFNCIDPDNKSVVGYLGESIWPPVTGIERSACSNYFQNVNVAELMRLQQAISERKLRPLPGVASVV